MVIYFMNKWHSLKTYCPTMMYVDDVILIYFFYPCSSNESD